MAQQGLTCLPAESSAVNGEIRFMLLSRLVTVIQAPLSTNQHQADAYVICFQQCTVWTFENCVGYNFSLLVG